MGEGYGAAGVLDPAESTSTEGEGVAIAGIVADYGEVVERLNERGALSPDDVRRERDAFRRLMRVRLVIPRVCALDGCDRVFTASTTWQSYCSEACRQKAYYQRKGKGE